LPQSFALKLIELDAVTRFVARGLHETYLHKAPISRRTSS
jgi:hypothetical protein